MTDRSAVGPQGERGELVLSSSVMMRPDVIVEERPTTPSGVTSGEHLPRDVLVRLAALSRRVMAISHEHAEDAELSMRLNDVVAGIDGLIQRIYDEAVQ
jgi:hypothetical protein